VRVPRRLYCALLYLPLVWSTATMADVDLLKVHTRFGTVSFVRGDEDCCTAYFRFHSQRIEISSAGRLSAMLEGVYKVKEGDVVAISVETGAKGLPPAFYILLVDRNRIVHIDDDDFVSKDVTFRAVQKGNDIHFDLGFDNGLRKRAIYVNGILYVGWDRVHIASTVPHEECGYVLKMLIPCKAMPDCSDNGVRDATPLAKVWAIPRLENMPVFKGDNFYAACAKICAAKNHKSAGIRRTLCGY
jgi:hypothetical protein